MAASGRTTAVLRGKITPPNKAVAATGVKFGKCGKNRPIIASTIRNNPIASFTRLVSSILPKLGESPLKLVSFLRYVISSTDLRHLAVDVESPKVFAAISVNHTYTGN